MPREISYLTPNQVSELEAACLRPQDRLLVRLLFQTGARVSEVLAVKPCDIDFEHQRLKLPALKRKDAETKLVIVDQPTLDLMKAFTKHMPEDKRLFDISRQKAYYIVRMAAKRAGLGKTPAYPSGFPGGQLGAWWWQSEPPPEATRASHLRDNRR